MRLTLCHLFNVYALPYFVLATSYDKLEEAFLLEAVLPGESRILERGALVDNCFVHAFLVYRNGTFGLVLYGVFGHQWVAKYH